MKNLNIKNVKNNLDITNGNVNLIGDEKQAGVTNNIKFNPCLIVCMTIPKIKNTNYINKKLYSSIASITRVENINFDMLEFYDRMELFGIKRFVVIFISDKYIENKISKDLNFNERGTVEVEIIYIMKNYFFSIEYMNELYDLDKNSHSNIIFGFFVDSWAEIVASFMSVDIEVSGGSNSKKHMFSPNHLRMSQFLYCLLGNSTTEVVNYSFHNSPKSITNKKINYEEKRILSYINNYVKKKPFVNKDNKDAVDKFKENFNKSDNKTDSNAKIIGLSFLQVYWRT